MSEPDDIDKLLREIDAMNKGGGPATPLPASSSGKQAELESSEKASASRGGRVAWAGTSAVGGLFVGGFTGTVLTFLPYVGTLSTALGAAVGAAAAGAVSGPPAWFRRR